MLRHCTIVMIWLVSLNLPGCTTLGDDFALENAAKVTNGMTREQVITVMGLEP